VNGGDEDAGFQTGDVTGMAKRAWHALARSQALGAKGWISIPDH